MSTDYLLGLIDTASHPIHYSVTEDLSLNESELQVIREMKKTLLEEISVQSKENIEWLERYWEFSKSEQILFTVQV